MSALPAAGRISSGRHGPDCALPHLRQTFRADARRTGGPRTATTTSAASAGAQTRGNRASTTCRASANGRGSATGFAEARAQGIRARTAGGGVCGI